MLGHRAIYKDGWRAVCPWPGPSFAEAGTGFGNPISAEKLTELDATGWELYHIDEDPAENHNLAADHRDKLIELIGTWYVEAGKYGVMPVDGSGLQRMIAEKPLVALPRDQYTYRPGTQSIPNFAAPRLFNRPHSITATVEIPEGGAEGVLFCQGTAAGGYSLYVKDGRLHYVHNYVARQRFGVSSPDPLPAGRHELRFEFEPTGQPDMPHGRGVPARLQLYVDGALVASADAPYTTPFMFNPGGVSCGHNPGSPVTPDYTSPFKFTGTPREGRRGRQRRADRRPGGRAAGAHGTPVGDRSRVTTTRLERGITKGDGMTERSLDELGPVDYLVVEFPAGQQNFTGEGASELLRLHDAGIIRIMDLIIVGKAEDGSVMAQELGDLDDLGELARIEVQLAETLAEADVEKFGAVMEPGSIGAVLVYENLWAAPFASAMRHAGGQVIANGRIPIQAIIAAVEADEALEPVGV